MTSTRRWNLLDVALIGIAVSIAAIGIAGYRRFQSPLPDISSVTPSRVVAGAGRPLSVHGRYLHPYLRAFVFPSGHAPAMTAVEPAKQEARLVTTTASQ